jgi:hypothetical protein
MEQQHLRQMLNRLIKAALLTSQTPNRLKKESIYCDTSVVFAFY